MANRAPRVPEWLLTTPIAHRGLHSDGRPENTLAAFDAACDAGFPIELDVRILADDTVIVFHDDNLQRAAGRPGMLETMSYPEIAPLRLFGTAERIPTLHDVLNLAAGRTPLLIEAKSESAKGRRLEDELIKILSKYDGPFALQSFNPFTVAHLRKNAPGFVRGQLAGDLAQAKLHPLLSFALKNLLFDFLTRPDFVAYDINSLPTAAVTRRRDHGTPVIAWTVTTEQQMAKARTVADNYIFEKVRPR